MVTACSRLALVAAMSIPIILAAAGCPGSGPAYPKCDNDTQCKKDKAGAAIEEYCVFGECQQCAKDSHCAAGETCNRGRCETSCGADDQCGSGQICEQSSCVPAQCSETAPCGAAQRCQAGRCLGAQGAAGGAVRPTLNTPASLVCDKEKTVIFDFNMSDLRPDAREVLDGFARCMTQNAGWRLAVSGHADERGTTEFNLQLGERRASSVRDYLSRLGVDKARIRTISYGEERPIDTSGTEEGWARNRRGELKVQE